MLQSPGEQHDGFSLRVTTPKRALRSPGLSGDGNRLATATGLGGPVRSRQRARKLEPSFGRGRQ
jgi:hypothetical protein